MSDSDASNTTGTGDAAETVESTDWKAEAEKWQALSRKNEERAKSNASAVKELEQLKTRNMSETEKAVAEAEKRGRESALSAGAERLARAELRAAASGRIDAEALNGFLEFADLKKFIGEDGEPNTKAIEAAVTKLGGAEKQTDFDGGARRTAGKGTDMNSLIRKAAGVSG